VLALILFGLSIGFAFGVFVEIANGLLGRDILLKVALFSFIITYITGGVQTANSTNVRAVIFVCIFIGMFIQIPLGRQLRKFIETDDGQAYLCAELDKLKR